MRKGFGQIWRFVKPRGLSLVMLFGFSWPSVSQEARFIPVNTEISTVYRGNMEQALSHVVLNLGMPDSTRLTQEGFTVLNPLRRDSGMLAGLVTRLSFVEQHSNAVSRPFGFRKLELGFFKFKDQARQMIKYLDVSCGLPSNLIYDVYESSTGEIWIAYAGGVAKLTSSVLYVADPKAGFPDFPVTSIQEFGSSMLLGTFGGGLIQINGASFKMHNESSGFCTNLILDMAVCDSVLYIGTYGEGLLAAGLNGETKKIVSAALEEHDVVQSLAVHEDTLYFIHKKGYAFLKDETLTVFDVSQGLPEDGYAAIEVDESGKIWLAGETQGLVSIQNGQVTTYPELNQATGPISIMYAGRSGNVWIGSANNGLFMVTPQGYLAFGSKDGLSSDNISSLRQDQFDNLWIGTNDGGVNIFIPSNFRLSDMPGSVSNLTRGEKDAVLGVYDNRAVQVYTDTAIFNISHPELSGITDVIYDSVRQCTWISTHRGLFRLRAEGLEKIIFSDGVSNISNHLSLMLDRQNALWICDYNFGVIKYTDESFFNYPDWSKNRNTLAIHTVQATNKIWASTSLGQISAFEGDSITEYFVTSNDIPVKFFGSCVIGDTVMFISNVGLILETGNTFFQVKMDGLDDDELFNSIAYEPSSKRLYVTTNSEIRALTVKGEHQVYHTHHDLIPVAFSKESGLTSPESNSVYFGTNRGVLQYVPFEFRNHAIRRKIVIEEFLIKSEEGGFTDLSHALDKVTLDSMRNSVPFGLTIPLEFNTIRLRFSCMDWGKETGTTYKYSLDGGTWSAFKSELDLANLKSGRHVLNVRAFLSGNLQSDDLVIRFEVVAPFYMRAWFVFAVLLVFIFGVWMMIRRFSSLNFDSFKSNTEIAFLLKKARVLALAAILLFFVIDLYHSRVNSDYTVNWYVNSLICLVALSIIVYTYLPHPRQRLVYNGLVYSFFFISLVTVFRTALNNFEPVLCIESALVLLFSIFIFAEIKNIFVYCSTMFLTALTATFFVDANPDHEALFLSAFGQVIIAVSLFGILERNNLSRILFAHKLLQFSRQYVLVANKNAEIVYVGSPGTELEFAL